MNRASSIAVEEAHFELKCSFFATQISYQT